MQYVNHEYYHVILEPTPTPDTEVNEPEARETVESEENKEKYYVPTRFPNEELSKEAMRKYIADPCNTTLVIKHPKVAQKSYGRERRLICPPPIISLEGEGWKLKQKEIHDRADYKDGDEEIFAFIGIDSDYQQLYFGKNDFSVARTLSVTETEKRSCGSTAKRDFTLNLKMFFGNGESLGNFESLPMSVIAKPSKKRKTLRTKYLRAEGEKILASSEKWGSFYIYVVPYDQAESEEFKAEEGIIHYGNTVKLVCTETSMALPLAIIGRVDGTQALLDEDDPVSELQKCCFRFRDNPMHYLAVQGEKIVQHVAVPVLGDHRRHIIPENCVLTIISTHQEKYTFCDTSSAADFSLPHPVIQKVLLDASRGNACLDLLGKNFSSTLKVWFGDCEAKTIIQSDTNIIAMVPDRKLVQPDLSPEMAKEKLDVPISLVRFDGVIFPYEEFHFTYCPETDETSGAPVVDNPSPKRAKIDENPTLDTENNPLAAIQPSSPTKTDT
ncbi:Oidioi.mRNA.OKI2018_I69.chr1.g1520.t1.cds [Oikopleura dioica]|uniref:Oidioi.mRNA.OKI2018_I69.chr1.g1520.t1.cds n=1 Tax=Oikopleura dioica TaxID=34765 RepID=A0ABN7SRQ4_OIKDI|nr:Oidioi.mRNA.OKI2018_I69.chr1.g1520.t1.cds [Oikopleura dioica]